MFEYTLITVNPLGEADPKYGQTYWATASESDMPLMFNSMESDIQDGAEITAEETANKRSTKGTDYLRLKKVKLVSNPNRGQKAAKTPENGSEAPNGWDAAKFAMQLNRMEAKLDKLLQTELPTEIAKPAPKAFVPDEVITDIGDEPINLEDIPF